VPGKRTLGHGRGAGSVFRSLQRHLFTIRPCETERPANHPC
jgi:hypothetical protein